MLIVWAGLQLDQYMSEKAILMRNKTRKMMDDVYNDVSYKQFNIIFQLIPYYNKAEFPLFPLKIVKHILKLIYFLQADKIREAGFSGLYIKDYGGPGLSTIETGAIAYELTKKDGSIATFVLVHNSLGTATIDKLGNDEQKQRMIPDLIAMNKIACWALTEPDFGSDASNI